jgi:PAS domain S-box-containing protein
MSSLSNFESFDLGQTRKLLAAQMRILEMIASRASLEDTLTSLASLVESQFEGLLCSVLLLDEDGQRVHHGAAPTLPAAYTSAIDGQQIGPSAGSCGTAMYRREAVFVTDILEDPRWRDYRDLATQHGLRACWSTPILSHGEKVLGSFAMYYREPRSPSPAEIQLITEGAHIASIAIERWQEQQVRQKVEKALRQSEEKFKKAFYLSPLPISITTLEGRFLEVNDAFLQLLGSTRGQVVSRTGAEMNFWENPSCRTAMVQQLREKGRVNQLRIRFRTALGEIRDGTIVAEQIELEGLPCILAITQDVTEARRAEEALRASEKRLRTLTEASFEGLVFSEAGIIQDANEQFLLLMGYAREEAIGASILTFIAPESRELATKSLQKGEPSRYDFIALRKDGSVYPAEVCARMADIGGRKIRVSAVRDLTARRQAEERVREAEGRLQRLADNLPFGIVYQLIQEHDGTPRFLYVSAGVKRMMGLTSEAVLQDASLFYNKIVAEDRAILAADSKRSLRDLTPIDIELRIRAADGGLRWGHLLSAPLRLEDGRTVWDGIMVDITTQRRAEEAQRRSEEKFSKAFRSNPEGMAISTRAEGRIIEVNQAFTRIMGYARSELIGRTVTELGLWTAGERKTVLSKFVEDELIRAHQTQLRAKGDRKVDVELSLEQIWVEKQPCLLTIIRDITEQRRLEQQYRAAQKMEAVGRLAGGIAHDFNNILGIVLGYVQLAQQRTPPDEALTKMLANIRKAGDRGAALTRQLLAFSRQQVLQPEVLDLNVVLVELWKLLPRLLGEDVDTELRLTPNLGRIYADRGQIEQVVMNLAVNARDAMPHGGKLLVETTEVELDSLAAARHSVETPPGRYVMLAVTDTGVGMDAETQSRIFEPFFTTKEFGRGTGLGLATAYGIVKQSGGHIWVYSEPGRGSAFKVFLPRAGAEAPSESALTSEPAAGGTETILVVEDETALREVTAEYLRRKGYAVLEAGDPQEALQVSTSHPGTIHLMVTDVVMPHGSGPEVAKLLLERFPHLHVIYVSGFTDQAIQSELGQEGTVFLQKPFPLDALARKVRSLLDGRNLKTQVG